MWGASLDAWALGRMKKGWSIAGPSDLKCMN
jgi:hypothetical protein